MSKGKEEFTLFVGNLSDRVEEDLLYELFLQAGPVQNVKRPTDSSGRKRSYAFVQFKHQCSLVYTMEVMAGTCLFNRQLRLQLRTNNHQQQAISSQGWNDSGPIKNHRMEDNRMRPFNRMSVAEKQSESHDIPNDLYNESPIVSYKNDRDRKRRNDHNYKYDHRKGKMASGNYRERDHHRNKGKNQYSRMNPY